MERSVADPLFVETVALVGMWRVADGRAGEARRYRIAWFDPPFRPPLEEATQALGTDFQRLFATRAVRRRLRALDVLGSPRATPAALAHLSRRGVIPPGPRRSVGSLVEASPDAPGPRGRDDPTGSRQP
jgi:hypothetical protein